MEKVSKPVETNHIGCIKKDYQAGKSTLCSGCGHDSITNSIINACYRSSISPYQLAKMSGIGCSSKTPAYFLGKSHGFNALHGRMAPVATGAKLANRDLIVLGVSGDGDTASIGLGGFSHLMRRNLPMLYIVENNGVYGLTKGQFSATAELNARDKKGTLNEYLDIDLCTLAIEMGATFVARSFSGDAKQLVPLISAAMRHEGTAFIDIVSPCVTFNNHEGSEKSYDRVKELNIQLQEMGFIQEFEEKTVEYEEGETAEVTMHDGSILTLKKVKEGDHDIRCPESAIRLIKEGRTENHLFTGLLYFSDASKNLLDKVNLSDKPLFQLDETSLFPSADHLSEVMKQFK